MEYPAKNNSRLVELDGLRAICVALVIFCHLHDFAKTIPYLGPFDWIAGYGAATGVHIFFVISGFIITRLALEEIRKTGSFSIRRFFIKRFFRIIPAFWLYLAIITTASYFGLIDANIHNLIFCVLFISNIVRFEPLFFYGHTWSLSVEEQYYLLFPVLMGLFIWKSRKTTTVWLIALFLLSLFSLHIGHFLNTKYKILDLGFLFSFRYILLGVALSLWWDQFSKILIRLGLWFPLTGLIVLLLAAYWCAVNDTVFGKYSQALIEPPLLALLMGWMLCNLSYFWFLRTAPFQWLGRCSYSAYLWQQLFTAAPGDYLLVPAPTLIGSLIMILLCSGLSYHFIERPFNHWGRTLIKNGTAKMSDADLAIS